MILGKRHGIWVGWDWSATGSFACVLFESESVLFDDTFHVLIGIDSDPIGFFSSFFAKDSDYFISFNCHFELDYCSFALIPISECATAIGLLSPIDGKFTWFILIIDAFQFVLEV